MDNTVLLSGVVGSTAYGLAGPDSDIDRLGIYAAPTLQFHGLHPPLEKRASVVSNKPDVTLHEAGKFANLALKCNPTVTELMWLSEYETLTPLGQELIDIRESFLSAKAVRNSYLGYATGQLKLLARKREPKHARHLLRLCHQGYHLYMRGQLIIKLDQPEVFMNFGISVTRDDGYEIAKDMIESYEDRFNNVESVLPEEPDEEVVEKWLLKVRAENL